MHSNITYIYIYLSNAQLYITFKILQYGLNSHDMHIQRQSYALFYKIPHLPLKIHIPIKRCFLSA